LITLSCIVDVTRAFPARVVDRTSISDHCAACAFVYTTNSNNNNNNNNKKTARVAVPIYYYIYGSRRSSIPPVLEGCKKKKSCIEIGSVYYYSVASPREKMRLNSKSVAYLHLLENNILGRISSVLSSAVRNIMYSKDYFFFAIQVTRLYKVSHRMFTD